MCFSSRWARRATGRPQSSVRVGARGMNSGVVACGGGWMAISKWPRRGGSPEQPVLSEVSCWPESGFEGRTGPKVALDAQAVTFQLGARQGLEPAQVPVLGGISRVSKQPVVREGVDRPAGQDLEHLRRQLRLGQGATQGH